MGDWAAHQSKNLPPCRCYPLPDLYNGPPHERSFVLKTATVKLVEMAQNFRLFPRPSLKADPARVINCFVTDHILM